MIWCVEDDSSIRDIEVYALTSTGFEATGFEDGDSFWNALQTEKPELVVLDVMLPGKDGVTLLKLMKQSEEFQDIPVIIATAKGMEYDKIQSLDLGADDYLVKPFGIMEMVSRVKAVLRISANQASAWALMMDLLWPIILIAVLAIGLSALLARRMAKNIVEPLNKLNLEQPLSNNTYEELSPLLRRINQQHLQIDAQMRKLQHKTDEFIQITSHMQEGLVVLDKETHIRSINTAAMRIFRAEETCVGSSIFQVNRSNTLRQALNDALDKGHGSVILELGGKIYRFDMSSIQSDGNLLGTVILAVDVTESQNAEQMRREFSANVSHELKTPLQGIIGSAELLESGMVKPEDTPRFVGHIRREASRLVNLIEDIIRLSQLDEGVALPVETVDMQILAEEVKTLLLPSAEEKNVSISISGEGFSMVGVRRMLQEIIYNLCDNAIKYNVPGGSVTIHVENNRLVVSDTGIGIPAEHQGRIFERFYRVDKSHSKNSGGTGLGLSIVKHAAAYHNAEIRLESISGKGTTITIQF